MTAKLSQALSITAAAVAMAAFGSALGLCGAGVLARLLLV